MDNTQIPVVVDFPQEWLEKALSITGKFEGRGYDNVTGNFDGMGISAGVLQWCIGQGSLQEKILKPFLLKHGSIDELDIFPSPIMDNVARMPTNSGLRLAIQEMNSSSGIIHRTYNVKKDWLAAWRKFLMLDSVVELQKIACEGVASEAMKYCKEWDMVTPRSFCWFFDIVTQNGSMKDVKKSSPDTAKTVRAILLASKQNQQIWSNLKLTDEQKILLIASYDRACLSRAAYVTDVMDRKGTIATGIGYVHGDKFENIT